MWQLIATLCQTAINTTLNTVEQFANFPLIDSILLSEELLKVKIQATLDQLSQISSATFIRPLTLVHRIIQTNELITSLSTNYIAITEEFGLNDVIYDDDMLTYSGIFGIRYVLDETRTICTCKNNGSCPIPAKLYLYDMYEKYGLYDLNTINANATISGT
ncbi:unnamed protein product [Adineta ricciae]|uniref:Uncharacterized protein n=1 Tax=Adineta ricciae TaxID=249248 RepID=A0A815YAD7_ADIRI|nr:unnamed protein product [Adineta ricciae]CAF1567589.1 unnamed protein product [Adineta ricciae]